jgi:hypothetical protein
MSNNKNAAEIMAGVNGDCDHCGRPLDVSVGYRWYDSLPFRVDHASKGEGGVVCLRCDKPLRKMFIKLAPEPEKRGWGKQRKRGT